MHQQFLRVGGTVLWEGVVSFLRGVLDFVVDFFLLLFLDLFVGLVFLTRVLVGTLGLRGDFGRDFVLCLCRTFCFLLSLGGRVACTRFLLNLLLCLLFGCGLGRFLKKLVTLL